MEDSIDIIYKHLKLLIKENRELKTENFELNERAVSFELDIKINKVIYNENIKNLKDTIKNLEKAIKILENKLNKN